ncbi:uncharacterized protein MELLADRAFT_70838 [Melampsora larici-populina 98AG31]|uniref:Secreted protein n=1 Tax=Melampsora larici-populina (strain 98AG31 / pathotype 3-4-7) TaxID=747676 RepID=F4R8F6_MELLP|nr:uncharacterized protein MELLADRAFT_70838 [Melampsora larici-populina 98AG31]EGG11476.1 secreted protein [Melampsora larici-populina 98AG31]
MKLFVVIYVISIALVGARSVPQPEQDSKLSQIRNRSLKLESRDGLLPFLPVGALVPTVLNVAPVKSLTGNVGDLVGAGDTGSKPSSGLLKVRRAAK